MKDTRDDWLQRERAYEAKHSPWSFDAGAKYLDEEHRKHCEARELRKAHEQNCEVEHSGQRKTSYSPSHIKIRDDREVAGNVNELIGVIFTCAILTFTIGRIIPIAIPIIWFLAIKTCLKVGQEHNDEK